MRRASDEQGYWGSERAVDRVDGSLEDALGDLWLSSSFHEFRCAGASCAAGMLAYEGCSVRLVRWIRGSLPHKLLKQCEPARPGQLRQHGGGTLLHAPFELHCVLVL